MLISEQGFIHRGSSWGVGFNIFLFITKNYYSKYTSRERNDLDLMENDNTFILEACFVFLKIAMFLSELFNSIIAFTMVAQSIYFILFYSSSISG